jgi:Flp pilus assembly protein TadG
MMRRSASTTGVVAVEFAFVLVILLLIMAGMVEFGRTFWYANALTKATRDGARLMSTWDASDINTGVTKAKEQVIDVAAAANVSPALTSAKVQVQCDYLHDYSVPSSYSSFSFGACSAGTPPTAVKVSISDFTVNLGQWFPFIGPNGLISFSGIALAPHTTMRYMK